MNKWFKIGLAAAPLLGVAGYALGQSGNIVTTLTGGELVQIYTASPYNLFVKTSTLANFSNQSELLYANSATAASTATTAEQTILSYPIPANTINPGDIVRVRASFSAAPDGNNKTFKCYIGSEVVSSGVLSTNGKNGVCNLDMNTFAAANELVNGGMTVDTTGVTQYMSTAAEALTGTILVKFTGTQGSATAGDIQGNSLTVEKIGP